jgi:small-conductance mechanosensitive channel
LDQWDIASDVRLELVKQLREHGIEVASPVRTLKVVAADQYDALTGHFDKRS